MSVRILVGDCRDWMAQIEPNSLDACVCDPPYHLTSIVKRFGAQNAAPAKVGKTGAYERASRGFMGQTWDGGDVAFDPAMWEAVYRILKPGAHLIAFSGTRTYHRMACAIEDAGFEIRDQLAWCYGSGFPKSHNVANSIDKLHGAGDRGHRIARASGHHPDGTKEPSGDNLPPYQARTEAGEGWEGWGTALKPAWEPICLARKPLDGTVAKNVLVHGTGALNIDGCRVHADDAQGGAYTVKRFAPGATVNETGNWKQEATYEGEMKPGRWPANILHDGSDEVLAAFPHTESGSMKAGTIRTVENRVYGEGTSAAGKPATVRDIVGDSGSAARFFYCAKATTEERGERNNHPTVKPIDLMRWCCRLITPPGGTIIDPFMGSGSTLIAADAEQFNAIGCELSADYAAIAEDRIRKSAGLFAEVQTETLVAAA
jgi:DNA modification methylase